MTALPQVLRAHVGALPTLFGEIAVDMFCGGGGMSLGFEVATGRCVDEAVNHDADAIWMHQANHPNTRHHRDSVWRIDPKAVADGRPVGWFHASPDCTHFSIARGGKPVRKSIRGLAWCALRWIAALRPRLFTMENVREFLTWGPLLQKRAGRGRWLWEVRYEVRRNSHRKAAGKRVCVRSGRRNRNDRVPGGLEGRTAAAATPREVLHDRPARISQSRLQRTTVEGPHADAGEARQWKAWLEALGYQLEPLMVPDRRRAGATFKAWKHQIELLGYKVEFQVLDAADYGAPTHRRRLFIVARRDGVAIRWPEKTHAIIRTDEVYERAGIAGVRGRGPRSGTRNRLDRRQRVSHHRHQAAGSRATGSFSGNETQNRIRVAEVLQPFRTAAECIDFSLTAPSIFTRKKPLAENTLRRIVRGLLKFSIESSDPYIVNVDHGGPDFRGQSIDAPLPTICQDHGFGLTVPLVVGAGGRSPEPRGVDRPFGTVLPRDWPAIIVPHITQYNGLKGGETRGFDLRDPFNVLPTENRFGFAVAFLYDRHRERAGQLPRVRGLDRPLGVIDATGNIGNLVLPYLVRHRFGEVGWVGVNRPLQTICAQGNHFSIVNPYLVEFANSTWNAGHRAIDRPVPALTATPKGGSWSLIAPLLAKFYRTGVCQPVSEPLDTVTGRHRFGYVAAHLTKLRGSGGWSSLALPLDTICAGATTFGLTTAWMVKHYGGHEGPGIAVDRPLDTITAKDHHHVATAFITQLRNTHGYGIGGSGLSLLDVMPTITGGGGHLYLTYGALYAQGGRQTGPANWRTNVERDVQPEAERGTRPRSKGSGDYGSTRQGMGRRNKGASSRPDAPTCDEGMTEPTVFTPRELMGPSDSPAINRGFWRVYDLLKRFLGPSAPLPIVRTCGQHREGVWCPPQEYLIYDIGMRMLTPRELLNAQFSPELAKDYVLTGTRESQVAKIGNSVPPLLGAAVVRANWIDADNEGGVAA